MTEEDVVKLAYRSGAVFYTKPPTRNVIGVSMTFEQLFEFVRQIENRTHDQQQSD